jgi:thioredoxin 1
MRRLAPPGALASRQETKYLLQHLINGEGDQQEPAHRYPLKVNNMADNNIQAVNDGNFEAEVLTASGAQPVIVDFWAEWCRPCHMLAPTVAEIAHDYAGKVKVTKLNVDEAMNAAGRYNIRGIPTILVFKNGQVVEQIVGAVPKDQITKAIDRQL